MSTNCVVCVVQKRTGHDLLCDGCRKDALLASQRDVIEQMRKALEVAREELLICAYSDASDTMKTIDAALSSPVPTEAGATILGGQEV